MRNSIFTCQWEFLSTKNNNKNFDGHLVHFFDLHVSSFVANTADCITMWIRMDYNQLKVSEIDLENVLIGICHGWQRFAAFLFTIVAVWTIFVFDIVTLCADSFQNFIVILMRRLRINAYLHKCILLRYIFGLWGMVLKHVYTACFQFIGDLE